MKKVLIAAFLSVALSGFAFAGENIQLAAAIGQGGDHEAAARADAATGTEAGAVSAAEHLTAAGTVLTTKALIAIGVAGSVALAIIADSGGTSTATHH